MFFKSAIAFAVITLFYRKDLKKKLHTKTPVRQGVKALFGLLGNYFLILSLQRLPLAKVTALSLSGSVFTILGGFLFFKERPYISVWIGMGICMVGVLIILGMNPWDNLIALSHYHINLEDMFPILSALFFSGSSLMVKSIAPYDKTITTLLYLTGMMALGSFVGSVFTWIWPDWRTLGLLIVIGGCYGLSQWIHIRAYTSFHTGFLSTFKFLRFPLNALVGLAFFAEIPSKSVIIGGGLILLINIILTMVEKNLKKKIA